MDALGRRIETFNWLDGNVGAERLALQEDYDAFGRVVRSARHHYTSFSDTQTYSARARFDYATLSTTLGIKVWGSGLETNTEYDLFGRKVREYNGGGDEITWTYNTDGQLTSHLDLGGVTTSYVYNKDGTLQRQYNNRATIEGGSSQNQDLRYTYDEAGHQTQISDFIVTTRTQKFRYDALGRQVVSQFADTAVSAPIVARVQSQYDTLGRLSRVISGDGAYVDYAYDANGNRRRTRMRYRDPANATGYLGREYWYKYDRLDRMTFGQGVFNNGAIRSAGRQTETVLSFGGSASGGSYYSSTTREIVMPQGIEVQYDVAGQRTRAYSMTTDNVWQYERYTYDGDGRLADIERDTDNDNVRDSDTTINTNLRLHSSRVYDSANRVTRLNTFKTTPSTTKTWGGFNHVGELDNYRVNTFDGAGRMVRQQEYNENGDALSKTQWTLDAAGNTRSYVFNNYRNDDYTNIYTYDYRKFDSYRESNIAARSSYFQPGNTAETYDHNGNLTLVDDATDHSRDRGMVYDLTGHIVKKFSGSKAQNYLYAEGAERASYGDLDSIDVDEGYSPIADTSIGTTAGSYTVTGNETLQTIAVSTWGDANLWYLIAEANGLSSGSSLRVGQTLTIPNRVANTRNSADVVKPYNPSAIIGDTTPNLPNPPQKGCGAIGMILMIVVAVVVTIFTAGAALGLMVPAAAGVSGGIMATGAAVLAGTASVASAGAMMAAAAIGAAVGSIASQGVGMMTGNVDKFSWKQVGIAALTAGVTAGVGATLGSAGSFVADKVGNVMGPTAGRVAGAMATSAVNNTVGQGMMMAVGAQDKFDWRSVASSTLSAGITERFNLSDQMTGKWENFGREVTQQFVKQTVNRAVQLAVYREGKMDWMNIAADAFGNVLANDIAPNVKSNTWTQNAIRMGVKSVTNYVANRFNGHESTDAWQDGIGRALAQEGADYIGDNSANLGGEGGLEHVLAHAGLGAMVAGVQGDDVGAGAIGGAAGALGAHFKNYFKGIGITSANLPYGDGNELRGVLDGFNKQLTMRLSTLLAQGIAERTGNDIGMASEAAGNAVRFNLEGQNGGHPPTEQEIAQDIQNRINQAIANHQLPNVEGLSPELKARLYSQLFLGTTSDEGRTAFANGKKVIFGMRVDTDVNANEGKGLFDDRVVILQKSANGNVTLHYEGDYTTEPSGRYEDEGPYQHGNNTGGAPNAGGDSRKDLGRLIGNRTYEYEWHHSTAEGKGPGIYGNRNVLAPTSNIYLERDINHDGKFTAADTALVTNPAALNSGRTVYFHIGYMGPTGPFTGSAACQTFPPGKFPQFAARLAPTPQQSRFLYTLKNM